ncbi:GNAT family N-acetyltransferase [Rhodobacteraceae bacterium 2CG4]|uniref:GNAT family N-acetyltransferase n=1 Tax=Halovulum marinum TaxID=2662447 RepID=A0A6L5Z6Q6_9RHOB|nr:GNAT family N-acetyltransferase [Halovulum marinum]
MRRARPKDAAACAAILRGWIDETPWFRTAHPPRADARSVAGRIDAGAVTVAERGGAVAAFLALEGDYVACLYVAPDARGAGLGRRLIARAKRRRQRLCLWTFQANAAARRFYEREGFVERRRTDGRDNDEGLPDVEYVWPAQEAA